MSWHYGNTELNEVALKIGVYIKCFKVLVTVATVY